jgi:hypothetical protein
LLDLALADDRQRFREQLVETLAEEALDGRLPERLGGERQPDRTFRVVDVEDGVDIVEVESARDRRSKI